MAFIRVSLNVLLLAVAAVALLSSLARKDMRAASQETVTLARGSVVALATPAFVEKGKRYAFSWPGGGPPQTFSIRDVRSDGWILVEVAEENVDPAYVPLGSVPTRWLNAALATSIQEMRPLLY